MDESEKSIPYKKPQSMIRKARSDLIIHAFGELSSVLTVFIRLTALGAY